MSTKVEFINPQRVSIEAGNGDRYIFGFSSSWNFQIDQQCNMFFSKCLQGLFDKYYDGSEDSIWGPIMAGMYRNRINPFLWVMNDRDKERERIGARIKSIRKEKCMEAKVLAQKVGIDPGNLSRIEQGKFSVGIDILNKIAGVLNMKLDFVPLQTLR